MPTKSHNLTPELYILDEDLSMSSSYLTDKDLDRNIKNSIKLMGSCILHLNGIRKSTVYNQYDKEDLRSIFKDYPIDNLPKPNFSAKLEYKYCRQCRNHFTFIAEVGKKACIEYNNRYSKSHKLEDTLDWYIFNVPPVLPTVGQPLGYPIRILPIKYRQADVVKAMRQYYIGRYRNIALEVYRRASVPEWFNLSESDIFNNSN